MLSLKLVTDILHFFSKIKGDGMVEEREKTGRGPNKMESKERKEYQSE